MASIIEKTWTTKEIDPKTGRERDVQRKGFQVQIRLKGHPTVYETFIRRTDAKLWAQKTEASMREGRFFPERKRQTKTVADLVDRYLAEMPAERKSAAEVKRHLGWWKEQHGHLVLANLNPEALAEIREELAIKASDRGKGGAAISGATVNRYMGALSHAFTRACEWGWSSDNPVKRVGKRKEPRGRVRMLSDPERDRLLTACRDSGAWYLEPAALLALCTGMRRGEILGLRWPDIDVKRGRLTLHETKNGERRGVALAGPALEVLQKLSKVRRVDDDHVFFGTGSFEHSWIRAVRKAGLVDFRFHDLRHTAASYLAMQGASPSEIAAVLGHKTLQMVKRYAHLHDAHVASVVTGMVAANMGGVSYAGPAEPKPTGDVIALPGRRKGAAGGVPR